MYKLLCAFSGELILQNMKEMPEFSCYFNIDAEEVPE
jgi:hypothetical protein